MQRVLALSPNTFVSKMKKGMGKNEGYEIF